MTPRNPAKKAGNVSPIKKPTRKQKPVDMELLMMWTVYKLAIEHVPVTDANIAARLGISEGAARGRWYWIRSKMAPIEAEYQVELGAAAPKKEMQEAGDELAEGTDMNFDEVD
ncbi:hypothetical protein N7499_011579 [Penicillium canescens]|uniref:Uncharacterized protein n=1 Tax=Penicillium canescens TaxID=5083 RepID=A0AAD6ND18_PENCN|nr:uncharacterized protein N7446_006838 [Penicillium canescens]KAJ5991035.1 hypothetical protein N7522_011242 [Penicillium canescens]KAJ6049834.1 hypothetical protein N7444_006550 [Penicillium canescens]KAJ6052196.1 hypothetical protein N7460_002730 [Penicillium canescens]KAJ6062718.1 hypothetical protein N7446_006838 [Penicillium canescens]KAJ6069692.1 hypothetical protein N7499_011579 [Penicillium canescens]